MTDRSLSRRGFLGHMALAGAAAAVMRAPEFMRGGRWFEAAHAAPIDVVHDTFNGLLAFVVPGTDAYSHAQGVSSADPGGVDAGATDALLATVDATTPHLPGFSAFVAAVLNDLANAVHPGISGPFGSSFANLSFAEKTAVFQIMDGHPLLNVLAGVLPGFVAFFVYSEAGTFDPATRSLTGRPLGWTLSNYEGVSDGRDEFRGYLHGRK
jgi:hypothetical protein